MDYFREEFDNVIFLYVSDDMEWGRRNLRGLGEGDLFFAGGRSAGEVRSIWRKIPISSHINFQLKDLAVLAACSHTVITWGTFSMWAALLAGGEYFGPYGPIVPAHLQHPKKKKKKKT